MKNYFATYTIYAYLTFSIFLACFLPNEGLPGWWPEFHLFRETVGALAVVGIESGMANTYLNWMSVAYLVTTTIFTFFYPISRAQLHLQSGARLLGILSIVPIVTLLIAWFVFRFPMPPYGIKLKLLVSIVSESRMGFGALFGICFSSLAMLSGIFLMLSNHLVGRFF